jgi:hypothetical protein
MLVGCGCARAPAEAAELARWHCARCLVVDAFAREAARSRVPALVADLGRESL